MSEPKLVSSHYSASDDKQNGVGRVFCVGMNKTGTSTMKQCFELLNIMPVACPTNYSKMERAQIHRFYDLKDYDSMLELATKYRAFEDRPWNMWSMYQKLDERFPNSQFILTERDAESWWRSAERWITVSKPEVLDRYQLHLRVHNADKDSMIESYLRYNQEVRDYFRGTGKLLIMNLEHGEDWTKLCTFLNAPIPAVPFPHANRQAYTESDQQLTRRKRRLRRGLQCHSCGNLTTVRMGTGTAGTNSYLDKASIANLPIKIARILFRQVRRRGLHNTAPARWLMYNINRGIGDAGKKLPEGNIDQRYRPNAKLPANELAVVACFYNPSGSKRRIENFQKFVSGMQSSGVRLLVVELAFGEIPFQVDHHDDVNRLRTDHVLWHKERLLNIGIKTLLEQGIQKIVWLDGDIRFHNERWPYEIARQLDRTRLCQVFESVAIQAHEEGAPVIAPSAMSYYLETGRVISQEPTRGLNILRGMLKGGQSGFGWAAQAELLEQVKLFDRAIVGGGDKLMFAASLAGQEDIAELKYLTKSNFPCSNCGHCNDSGPYTESYLDWAGQWSAAVGGKVSYAKLHIGDMYHGRRSDRGYLTRHDILYKHKYDPMVDVVASSDQCLEWSSNKADLRRDVEAYFLSRREDI